MSARADSDGAPCICLRYLADVDAQLEQLAVDARGAPKRVVAAHLPYQFSNFHRYGRAPGLPAADLPSPEQAESFAVPGNHGIRFYDAECRAPPRPTLHKARPTASGQTGSVSASSRSVAKRSAD